MFGGSLESPFIWAGSQSVHLLDVFPLKRSFALLLALFLAVPATVTAQDGDWLSTFEFDQLKFVFWPAGVENRQDSDGKGSAITVHADRVAIKDWDALDVRHCIDGDQEWCSYPELARAAGGNNNGQVEPKEIQSFQTFAQIGLRSQIEKVDQLADTLQANITVDGLQAKSVKITKLVLHGAEGTVDSNETIFADVEAKATYENDKDAKTHLIKVGTLKLKPDGFVYKQSLWSMGPAGWKFDTAGTKPNEAKPFVTEKGYFSSQDKFEQLSATGIELVATKGEASKKSPGIGAVAILGALAVAFVVLRRRI
jgi:hypothetical protein